MLSHILISTLILSIAAAPASSTSLEVRTSRRSLGGRAWQRKCKVLKADEWVQFKEGGDVGGVVRDHLRLRARRHTPHRL